MNTLRALALVAAVTAAPLSGFSQLNLITTRAAFPTSDSVDWSRLGGVNTSVDSPFTIATEGGSTVTVSHNEQDFVRLAQTTGGWFGNFAFGEALLWNAGDNGAITFDPANLISGAGFEVQSRALFGNFTIALAAFDVNGGLLGSVQREGYSFIDLDTALFIGFTSASINVDKFVATLVNSPVVGSSDFAINSLALSGSAPAPGPVAVPEPSVYGLMGVLVLFGLVGRERLRRVSHLDLSSK